MSTKDEIIWKNVTILLDAKDWSYADLARKIGVTPQSLHAIKVGSRGIGPTMLKRFASVFNISESSLLVSAPPQTNAWPESVKKQCETVARILMSDHEPLKQALLANIAMFEENLQQSEKIKQQEEEIREIRRDLRELIRRERPGCSEPPGNRDRSGKVKAT